MIMINVYRKTLKNAHCCPLTFSSLIHDDGDDDDEHHNQ